MSAPPDYGDAFPAPPGNGFSHQLLVVALTVHIGGIQEIHSLIQRVMNHTDGFAVIGGTIGAGHGHAAQPHRGAGQPAVAKFPLIQFFLLLTD